jgi:hypothetical protein
VDFLWVILALTLVRGVIYAVLNPPFGSPDELAHYEYVRALGSGAGDRGVESHQPVLYYALMVPAYWLTAGAAPETQDLAIRLASLPFLLGVVLFTWLAARRMAPGKPFVPVVAAALVGLHPQLAYIGASANNDNAANLMGAVLTYLVVQLLSGDVSRRTIFVMIFAVGASLVTKGQILPMAALSLLMGFGAALAAGSGEVRWALTTAGGLLAIAGALLLRTSGGAATLTDSSGVLSVVGELPKAQGLADQSGAGSLAFLFGSLWASFVVDSVQPNPVWYLGPTAVVVLAAVGHLARLAAPVRPNTAVSLHPIILRLALGSMVVGCLVAVYLRYLDSFRAPFPYAHETLLQGRFLFVALPALALLVADGLDALAGRLAGGRLVSRAVAAAVVGLAAFDLASLLSLSGWYGWLAAG